ncbi:hypothetical protein [Endozoicomonas sp. ONNA2]|uniref:hypothetical protein n=1 Tax=Endozoicomonas sp. ONNA2 TaxID=2828741 RepID=UPI002147462F|nr:hypothetical protein [Endozoicomonas sp. ONNA2]
MDFRVSVTNAQVNHGAPVNDDFNVASGHSPPLGSVDTVSTELQIPGVQGPDSATASNESANESVYQRVISRVTETGNNLLGRVNSTVGMTSRAMQIFSVLDRAFYYRDSPEAVAQILSLAGIYGKLAQFLATRMDVLQDLMAGSDSQAAEFFTELMTAASRYPAGELNIDYVLGNLERQIAESG